MQSLYISRVIIKNFRNFEYVDVNLGHKQVIIGENNIGKTNFLRALQLILDPTLADEDRYLDESDFFDGLEKPMENKEEIVIKIYISNYSNNKTILATLSDATVKEEDDEEKLLITYKFFPQDDSKGGVEYQFTIFKGKDETKIFGAPNRKYLNIKVIKALRDVESELRNTRTSPVNKLLKNYAIDKTELERIAEEYKNSGDEILNLDELKDLSNNINRRFSTILGNSDFDVSLKAMEIDPNKVLSSLKLLMTQRNTSDISLGLNNILYISMVLQLLQDKTVPTYISGTKYDELFANPDSAILAEVYEKNEKGNYFLKEEIEDKELEIYNFMEKYRPNHEGVTLLAIEEPEAHLHPVYQRLIYKDVIRNSHNSVLLTTHSTHITAIAPIDSIVHLHAKQDCGTAVHATADMKMETGEFLDVERYLDVKRGEIYLGKAVVLVEGIAEEYMIPKFAELLGKPLDEKGIIVCNINSTNFTPYVKMLRSLEIPYAVITDGDFYYLGEKDGEPEKVYHKMAGEVPKDTDTGYLGNEIITSLVEKLKLSGENNVPEEVSEQDDFCNKLGLFIGCYTFEVDMMEHCKKSKEAKQVLCDLFNELTDGGKTQKANFKKELESEQYWKCLRKIEGNGIGKGRFSQRLSAVCSKEHIPLYIKKAINYIYRQVSVL